MKPADAGSYVTPKSIAALAALLYRHKRRLCRKPRPGQIASARSDLAAGGVETRVEHESIAAPPQLVYAVNAGTVKRGILYLITIELGRRENDELFGNSKNAFFRVSGYPLYSSWRTGAWQ